MTQPDCTCDLENGYECGSCMDRKWDAFVSSFPAPPAPARTIGGRFGDRCPECGCVDIHAPHCQQ